MSIASEIQQVLPDCYLWQAWCPSSKVDLTSHAVIAGDHLYFIDPIDLAPAALQELEESSPSPAAIILTNGNHERAAAAFQSRYKIPIYATPEAAGDFACSTTPIPKSLADLDILPLPGAGTGEIAIHRKKDGLLILGDILINLNSFAFAPLPEKYATDPAKMRDSLRSLAALPAAEVLTLCFAHGFPIISQAASRLAALSL